jgi:hypothetical protein
MLPKKLGGVDVPIYYRYVGSRGTYTSEAYESRLLELLSTVASPLCFSSRLPNPTRPRTPRLLSPPQPPAPISLLKRQDRLSALQMPLSLLLHSIQGFTIVFRRSAFSVGS